MNTTLALGMVVWLVTTILVESELCRPIREAVERWAGPSTCTEIVPDSAGYEHYRDVPGPHPIRLKLAYLVHCHLCAGTWIGLVAAAVTPYRPLDAELPLVAWALAGLLYKAIAHTVLAVNNTLRRYS